VNAKLTGGLLLRPVMKGAESNEETVITLICLNTTSVYADRTGQTYGDRIYPDELVDDVREFTSIMDEAIPQPAIDWLMSQPACAAQK